jgi:hypothetical protein
MWVAGTSLEERQYESVRLPCLIHHRVLIMSQGPPPDARRQHYSMEMGTWHFDQNATLRLLGKGSKARLECDQCRSRYWICEFRGGSSAYRLRPIPFPTAHNDWKTK